MKLSDIMSAAGLAGYAEVAMVLFLAVFLVVAFRLFSGRGASEWECVSRLPLSDGDTDSASTAAPRSGEG